MAAGTINSGKNIKFLLGTQANLEGYISGSKTAAEGAFYLTNDTHRLYVGTANGKAVPVNEGVITVSDLTALKNISNPHVGEFYYVTAGNILCVYSGANGWVQINNNSDTYLVDTDTEISLSGKVATITTKYTDNTGTTDNSSKLTDSWQMEVAGGLTIQVNGDKITLTSAEIKDFTVADVGTGSDEASVTLADTFGKTAAFTVKSGNANTMTVKKDDGDTVLLTVKDMSNTEVKATAEAEGFKIAVKDIMGTQSGTFSPAIKVGASGDTTKEKTLKFVNGTATLPVYTKQEIDDIKLALNAMTYRGLVGTNASSTQKAWSAQRVAAAEIGDTYLFAEKVTISGVGTFTKGTLAIARGNETNGIIPAGNVIWDYVESTVDVDTKYELNNQATSGNDAGFVQLVGKVSGTTESGEKVFFENGTAINAVVTVDNDGHAHVKFNHEGITAQQTTGTKAQDKATYSDSNDVALKETTITTLESITVNSQGHVTNYKTNTVTLRDTNAVINKVGMSVGAASAANEVTLTSSVQLKDGAGVAMTAKTGTWKMKSDTLVFNRKDDGASVGIDLVWGSFA